MGAHVEPLRGRPPGTPRPSPGTSSQRRRSTGQPLAAIERSPRWAAAIAVTAFALVGTVFPFGPTPQIARWTALAAIALTVAELARRRAGGRLLLAGLLLADAGLHVIGAGGSATLSWFGMIILAAWAAYALPNRVALTFAVVICAPMLAQWMFEPDTGWASWTAGTLFTGFACVQDTRQRVLLQELRRAQAELATRAAAEERARIARELHDVIGHALTVSTLHISSARLALADEPAEAEAALAEAERLTQAGLAEVRTAVGLLTGPSSRQPLPGAAEIPELIETFRRAGGRIDVEGEFGSLNATLGLTVYRILQEALTNAVRHAHGSPVSVTVTVNATGAQTRLVVQSEARPTSIVGSGSGLVSMRERAEAVGGNLTAGPHETGWRVEAVLPT
ncbi:histidine kinase [Kineosporia rhizophila]|uniref:sensor histidine kinase n=1 Tax=Kineosporia rhizophila TaxID=84633 RepID=UPI001E3C5B59|nr:histidine kinase [Kineosporia rhizophila]